MKTVLLSTVISLSAIAGFANAAEPQSSLGQVTVHSGPASAKGSQSAYTLDCAPPNSSEDCAAFHREIRRSFSRREIGMLFGSATAYPEYRTSYSKVTERYDNFTRTYDEQHLTAFASK
jgi:hypothetical protein